MTIDEAFPLLIQQEGISVTCQKNDKGGLTKYGITQASYPTLDIANLTTDKAKAIYCTDYWNAAKCSELKEELQYIVFSCAVNCGPGEARILLERAGGTNATKETFAQVWREHYTAIVNRDPSQSKWLKGWNNRVDFCLNLKP